MDHRLYFGAGSEAFGLGILSEYAQGQGPGRRIRHKHQISPGGTEVPDTVVYDAIVVGGRFAGLAVAMQLPDHRVLLIDQYPIGSHQMSACGTPLATAKAVNAEEAILDVHRQLVLHASGSTVRFTLRDPYVTFDYAAFCKAMLAQTDAVVLQAQATRMEAHRVQTTQGTFTARFVVNASGWRFRYQDVGTTNGNDQDFGYGLETELPVRWRDPGLHFFFAKRLVRNGYAWIFPCGETTRFGIGAFDRGTKLRGALEGFLQELDLEVGGTHGGVLAVARRRPIEDGVFLVGDAAGQCLPATGEGIRTAIFHGIHCGRAIASALEGRLSPAEASRLYTIQVQSMDRFHKRLLALQRLVAYVPESFLGLVAQLCARPSLSRWIMDRYWTSTGWFLPQSA